MITKNYFSTQFLAVIRSGSSHDILEKVASESQNTNLLCLTTCGDESFQFVDKVLKEVFYQKKVAWKGYRLVNNLDHDIERAHATLESACTIERGYGVILISDIALDGLFDKILENISFVGPIGNESKEKCNKEIQMTIQKEIKEKTQAFVFNGKSTEKFLVF